jgi:hypothetical protein
MLDWELAVGVWSAYHTCTKRVAYMLGGAICIAEALDSEVRKLCREVAHVHTSF